MIERNPLPPHRLPLGSNQTDIVIRSRRKRNRVLLFIILVISAALLWKIIGTFELDRIIPETNIEPAAPITALHPILFKQQTELIAATKKAGITILITDGFRSIEEQNVIYAKGRTEEGPIVTQVQGGHSYHNYGLAIDFALRTTKGKVVWDMKYDGNGNGKSDWMEVVEIAKQLGFSWGGDWDNFPDYPHLQMDFGYSIRDLRKGKQPPLE